MTPRRTAAPPEFPTSSVVARPAARTTNEDVRQQNLAAVLQLVHGAGATSRSEIGASTGLNRSTVTGLVQELLDLQLVCETAVKPTGRVGRPSLGVAAEDRVVALSVTADPLAVSVALVGLGGAVHSRVRHDLARPPSPRRFAQVANTPVRWQRSGMQQNAACARLCHDCPSPCSTASRRASHSFKRAVSPPSEW